MRINGTFREQIEDLSEMVERYHPGAKLLLGGDSIYTAEVDRDKLITILHLALMQLNALEFQKAQDLMKIQLKELK